MAFSIVGDDGVRGLEDYVCRAVVLFEADDFRAWKELFIFQNVLLICAAPAIDGLVVVADGADILDFACEQDDEI